MKKIIFTTIVVLLFSCFISEAKEKSLVYHSYDKETGDVVRETFVDIKDLPDGGKRFIRKFKGDGNMITDEIIVDSEYNTQVWKRKCFEIGTDFTGENDGSVFTFKGKLKNVQVNKVIDFKSRPFYIVPKINLSKFALSSMPQLKFVIPNRNKLTKMVMQAKKRGEETIEVNGKKVEAIKIYYSATGVREKHYSRDYYFRKSDGIFLKKVEPDGSIEELVSEK